jgi:hypothetical protein
MRLKEERGGGQRTVLVLVILLAFVTLQSVTVIVEHPHNHGKDHSHCCAACHAGHLGVLQAAADLRPSPPDLAETRLRPREYPTPFTYLGVPNPSRAPPA